MTKLQNRKKAQKNKLNFPITYLTYKTLPNHTLLKNVSTAHAAYRPLCAALSEKCGHL